MLIDGPRCLATPYRPAGFLVVAALCLQYRYDMVTMGATGTGYAISLHFIAWRDVGVI